MDQCATSQSGLLRLEVVETVRKICDKLEFWCEEGNFPEELVSQVNTLYPSLESCDFLGQQEY